jgi:hypothetical protein
MMTALEQLFRLEVEFHRKLRTERLARSGTDGVHTSYALQCGYEGLVQAVGTPSARDIEQLRERLTLAGDLRDVLAARDSVMQLLGLRPVGP